MPLRITQPFVFIEIHHQKFVLLYVPRFVEASFRRALQQLGSHALVEKLRQRNVVRQSLAPSRFYEEISRQTPWRTRFQGMQHDAPVQGIPGHDGPVIEHGVHHGLTLRESSQIGLEAEAVEHGQERLDAEEGRTRDGFILYDVPPAFGQHWLDRAHNVAGALDLESVPGFHEPGRRRQQGGVHGFPRARNDLAAASMNGFIRQSDIENFEFGGPHGLLAQRTFSRGPLKTLNYAGLTRFQLGLVHFTRQSIIHENICSVGRGASKSPN